MIMEFGDRPQQSHPIFICFTSRASSSSTLSMRIPSTKSFPSPGRRDQPVLSASRSRRLRNSGSLKGAQSPGLFASVVGGGSRKKNGSFETVEPSSPKVTCIGQVRVKTGRKKKGAVVMRSRSRRVVGGEMSFRRSDHRGGDEIEGFPSRNQNQKWVHLPLGSICEAVKAFGSEINCFSPCGGGGGMCSSGSEREKVGKRARGGGIGSCGTTVARCLLAIEEEHKQDNGMREDVGILDSGTVVKNFNGDGERRGSRREAMREMELVADELQRRGVAVEEIGAKVENVDVPVCVPPRNALLLMRCRSDPVRMSELATRFGSFPVAKVEVEEGNLRRDDKKEEASGTGGEESELEQAGDGSAREHDSATSTSAVLIRDELEKGEFGYKEVAGGDLVEVIDDKGETFSSAEKAEAIVEDKEKLLQEEGNSEDKDQDLKEKEEAKEEEKTSILEENLETEKQGMVIIEESEHLNAEEEKENIDAQLPTNAEQTKERKFGEEKKSRTISVISMEKEGRRWSFSKERRRHSFSTEKDVKRSSSYKEKEAKRSSFSSEREVRRSSFSSEMEFRRRRRSFSSEKQGRRDVTLQEKLAEDAEKEKNRKPQKPIQTIAAERGAQLKRTAEDKGEKGKELPDCLLMMMYEPKLSMEVSKETWVCKADFVRPHHNRPRQNELQQSNKPKPDSVLALAVEETKEEKEPTKMTDMKSVPQPLALLQEPTKMTDMKSVPQPLALLPPPSDPPELVKQVEQKLGNAAFSVPAAPYGPFVLTRCKSEPVRSSAKMLPDAYFWKNRHQPISTAGIGF